MGFSDLVLLSCALSYSGNTIRPAKHYLLWDLEKLRNKTNTHKKLPITADWIKVLVKS